MRPCWAQFESVPPHVRLPDRGAETWRPPAIVIGPDPHRPVGVEDEKTLDGFGEYLDTIRKEGVGPGHGPWAVVRHQLDAHYRMMPFTVVPARRFGIGVVEIPIVHGPDSKTLEVTHIGIKADASFRLPGCHANKLHPRHAQQHVLVGRAIATAEWSTGSTTASPSNPAMNSHQSKRIGDGSCSSLVTDHEDMTTGRTGLAGRVWSARAWTLYSCRSASRSRASARSVHNANS